MDHTVQGTGRGQQTVPTAERLMTFL